MRAFKSKIQENRSIASLLFVFLYFYAGLIGSTASNLSVETKSQLVFKKDISQNSAEISQADDQTNECVFNQSERLDSDLDDAELGSDLYISTSKFLEIYPCRNFLRFFAFNSNSQLPLYDLFCSWKFHFSSNK